MEMEGDLASRCADTLRSFGAPASAAGAAFALWFLSAPRDRLLLGGRLAPRVAGALTRLGDAGPPEVVPPGLAIGAAIGMAWASRGGKVYALLSADELAAMPSELTALAVRLGLGNLRIVVYAEEDEARRVDDRLEELAARGWLTATAGAHDARPLGVASGRRPSILYCVTVRRPAPIAAGAPVADDVRALVRARALARAGAAPRPAPIPVQMPEQLPADVGAFALGVALSGSQIPIATLPLADAYALTPFLRLAARRQLPVRIILTEDDDAPCDAVASLSLIVGLEVGRSTAGTDAVPRGPSIIIRRSGTVQRRSNSEHASIGAAAPNN
jgi:hypothetical protein